MNFTTEELTEMRKLAGIEYSTVDYRRPQDFLPEARTAIAPVVAESVGGKDKVPPKSIPTKRWTSKTQKITLKALLAKHKNPKECSTGRCVSTEVKGEGDSVDGGEVSTGRKPAIEK